MSISCDRLYIFGPMTSLIDWILLYVLIALPGGSITQNRRRHISLFLWSSQISSKTVFLGLFFIIWRFLWSRLIWRFGVIRTRYILIRRFCVIDPPGCMSKILYVDFVWSTWHFRSYMTSLIDWDDLICPIIYLILTKYRKTSRNKHFKVHITGNLWLLGKRLLDLQTSRNKSLYLSYYLSYLDVQWLIC
jgi:hypothetical protein